MNPKPPPERPTRPRKPKVQQQEKSQPARAASGAGTPAPAARPKPAPASAAPATGTGASRRRRTSKPKPQAAPVSHATVPSSAPPPAQPVKKQEHRHRPSEKKPDPPAPAPHAHRQAHAPTAKTGHWPELAVAESPFAGKALNKKQQAFLKEVYDRHQIEYLEKRLGLTFHDKSLLVAALTHPSFVGDHPEGGLEHYQRLEFLGDSVLSLYLARTLFLRFPEFAEGPITRIKSSIEQDAELSVVATELGLGRFLVLGRSEMLTGGMTKSSILAAATEALIGAVYLDGGSHTADKLLDRLIGPRIPREITTSEIASDPKSKLQDILQKRLKSSPVYHVNSIEGPEHDRMYSVQVMHKGRKLGLGLGRSKKEAEQEAARVTLTNFMDYLQSGQ